MRALPVLVLVLAACGSDDSSTLGGSSSSTSSGSSSSSSSGSTTTSATGGTANELCVNIINEYRAQKGLPAYTRWTDGETCADSEAQSDADTSTPHGAFPKCKELAQNECPGQPGPPEKMIKSCLAAMWAQGPGEPHYDAMASTKWKQVACGFGTTPRGAVWSVQNYR